MSIHVVTDDGHWVSQEFIHLAETLQDYDSALELRWIPPEHRTTPHEQQNPWALFSRGHLVFLCSERDQPKDILGRIIAGDQKWGNVLERMDAVERAQRILEAKAQMEAMEAGREEMEFLMRQHAKARGTFIHRGKKLDGNTLKEVPGSGRAHIL